MFIGRFSLSYSKNTQCLIWTHDSVNLVTINLSLRMFPKVHFISDFLVVFLQEEIKKCGLMLSGRGLRRVSGDERHP